MNRKYKIFKKKGGRIIIEEVVITIFVIAGGYVSVKTGANKDLFLNACLPALGGAIGYLIVRMFRKIKRRGSKKEI